MVNPVSSDVRHSNLRELLTYTRDGEWGEAEFLPGLTRTRVIRGTDFDAVRLGDISSVPTRYVRSDVVSRKSLKLGDIVIETAGGSKTRPTGRTLLIKSTVLSSFEGPVTCASIARILRPDTRLVKPSYLFWLLQYMYSSGQIEQF